MARKTKIYEKNLAALEEINEALANEEIGVDDLVEKSCEALAAARTCMDILRKQKGEFRELELEFDKLLAESEDEGAAFSGGSASSERRNAAAGNEELFDFSDEDADENGLFDDGSDEEAEEPRG